MTGCKWRLIAVLVVLGAFARPIPTSAQGVARNGEIIFMSNRTGSYELYTVSADGTDLRQLTDTGFDHWDPVYSPDGTHIAFTQYTADHRANLELYVMAADGTGARRVTDTTAAGSAQNFQPAWSPDGTRLTFVSNRDGNNDVYVINANGTGETNVSRHPASDVDPVWTPDGKRILFASQRPGFTRTPIYGVNPDGSGLTEFGVNSRELGYGLSWSPDGSTLSFTCNWNDRQGLCLVKPALRTIRLAKGSAFRDVAPDWSPDARFLIVTNLGDSESDTFSYEDSDIFTINLSTGERVQLTNSPRADINPDWRPVFN